MIRVIVILLVGVSLGAASVYLYTSQTRDIGLQPGRVAAPVAVTTPGDRTSTRLTESPDFATTTRTHEGRQAFYHRVTEANEAELIAMIKDAVFIGEPHARRVSTQILLSRYAEFDPQDAIRLARTVRADPAITASLYAVWARSNRNDALDALADEPNTVLARKAAVLLVEELGGDTAALLDVIAALPPHVDESDVEIDVLVARSVDDPAYAISEAIVYTDPAVRRRALKFIARKLATIDPHLAFSAANQIFDKSERQSFQSTLLREWAVADPTGVFAYLESADMSSPENQAIAQNAYSTLTEIDPQRVLTLSEQWPSAVAESTRYWALRRWAEYDPQGALVYVENQPPGAKRDELLSIVAHGFGQADTEAALAWAKSLQPSTPGLVRSVIRGLARVDPDRAFDLALTLESDSDKAEALHGVLMQSTQSGATITNIADRLLALEDDNVRERTLQYFGHVWARQDPASALDWIFSNHSKLPDYTIQNFSRLIAERDPELAAGFTSQVPVALRADWIGKVAAGFAHSDPDKAMTWISQYRGQPGYDRAVAAIVQQSAQNDPVAAARNIDRLTDTNHATIVANTAARQWAARDPESAARWAENIQNERVREIAVRNVANQWANRDPDKAARWVLAMPADAARDNALRSVVSGIARKRVPDEKLLLAFTNDMARQQAVIDAAYQLASRDRATADRLIQRYVSDSTLRYQAEQNLASRFP